MRDDNYLQQRLDHIWDRYFSDIEQGNDVRIQFGRRARTRLGSIKQLRIESNPKSEYRNTKHLPEMNFIQAGIQNSSVLNSKHKPTLITINGLFKDNSIPEFLIDSVIAHEMVHYAHGFASPHEKKYATPHAGGIIKREMKERGLEDLFILQKKWLKENWKEFVAKKMARRIRARRKRVLFIYK